VDDAVGKTTDAMFPFYFSLSIEIAISGKETTFYRYMHIFQTR
jgi:hypothetical protein